MEKISVTDFGPIRHAEIEIKPFCILIGHTSSGKSTVAKLLDLFNSEEFYAIRPGKDLSIFISLLKKYDIDFDFKEHTCIVYQKDKYTWTISQEGFETNLSLETVINKAYDVKSPLVNSYYTPQEVLSLVMKLLKEKNSLQKLPTPEKSGFLLDDITLSSENLISTIRKYLDKVEKTFIYIPAERIFMSALSRAIFSFYSKDINLPDCLKAFGNIYSIAKSGQKQYKINFMDLEVDFNTETGDKIQLKTGETISLNQASTGLQSIIPLLSVFDFNLKENSCRIIEEPELNLYTQVQKDLTEYLVKRTKEAKAKLFITTHSPYILSTIQNLLQAGNVAAESLEKAEQVAKLVSPDKWIDYNELTCQFFSNDGTSHNILDNEYHTIGINQMDDVSAELSEIYDSLLDIKYNE